MLIKYSLSHNNENLKKVIQKDSEPFEFFKDLCSKNSINAIGVTLQKNDNSAPILSVYITNEVDSADIKETIDKLWQVTCITYPVDLADCYVDNMAIKVYIYHELYYNNFTRAHKENISALLMEKYTNTPKDIFASSTGYLTLVYEESNYQKIEHNVENIKADILEYTSNTMLNELEINDLPDLKINIFHNKMAVDLYGYSRED